MRRALARGRMMPQSLSTDPRIRRSKTEQHNKLNYGLVEVIKEVPPLYQPPYDSPIEEIFAWHCTKYLCSSVAFDTQVELDTRHGQFRMDFVLTDADQKVAVECDGHEFHDPFRDEFRDAILLGEDHLETIYHFRGCDLTYHAEDCLWLMSILNPNLFSERGRLNLSQLHKLEIVDSLTDGESYMLRGRPGERPYWFWAFRRNIHLRSNRNPRNPNWPYWRVLYRFVCKHPSASLDELVTLWRRRQYETSRCPG